MKNLVILISILIINNGFVNKPNPFDEYNSNDIFYELILNEIPEKLFINNKVIFKSYAKWRTQLDDICGSRSKFLNDNECQILIKKFSEQDKELNISDSLKNKMNDIAERLYNNSEESKVSYLLSNPIFIRDDKVVIIKAVFFKKGGGQSAYVFKKENNKWFIDERQGLVDY